MSELHHCECVTNRATTKKVNYQDKRLKQKLLPQNDVIMEENILYCLVGSFFFWRFPLTKGLSVYVDLQIWHFRDQIPTLS